jgi:predicted ATP-grasp superfamily ATP-dependent carboligase
MTRAAGVVLAGISVRAMAESAARAGWRVWAADGFGDLDLATAAELLPLGVVRQGEAARAAARAARQAPAAATHAAYAGGLENWPEAVTALARGRRLIGNGPAVLRRTRDPLLVARALARRGLAVPETRASPPDGAGGRWLVKPRRSGGGHDVRPWRSGEPVPRSAYLQRRIAGEPGSVVFAADGRRAAVLGVSRQLVGDRAFGATGFRYCGSLLAVGGASVFERHPEIVRQATVLATAVVEEFGVTGVNGVDFIARAGVPMPIEINPRYAASMELVERATGLSIFAAHEAACGGTLLSPRGPRRPAVFGKAIVFAPRAIVVGDTRRRLGDRTVRDIPRPGERIGRGRPVCTVFASARSAGACYRALRRRAAGVLRGITARERSAAA